MAVQRSPRRAPARRRYAPRLPAGERREQLLDAALKLIVAHGYSGVSMEAVAREAGVTKPVVYEQFANRGEVLQALLEREEGRAFATLARVVPRPVGYEDPDALLVDVVVAFLQTVSENPDPWRLILLPADGTPEVVRRHVERGRDWLRERLRELVDWGLESRGGPAGLDTEISAHALVALGEQAGRLVLAEPSRFTPERFGEFAKVLVGALPRKR